MINFVLILSWRLPPRHLAVIVNEEPHAKNDRLLRCSCRLQTGGFDAYQKELAGNPSYSDLWDEWCLVAYFSQRESLKNVEDKFLRAIASIIYSSPVF